MCVFVCAYVRARVCACVTPCFEITVNRRQFYFWPKLWSNVAWQPRTPDLVEQTAVSKVKILCQFQELSRKRGPTFDDEDTEDKKKEAEEHNLLTLVRGFAKKKNPSGWLGPGLTRIFFFFLENRPKIALNQYDILVLVH